LELDTLNDALRSDTILVSVMHVNNEIGVIQDITAISELVHQHGALLHVDAAQSIAKCPIDVKQMGVDLLSLSAQKAYGPKGVGGLYIRRKPRIHLSPLYVGGGQEHGLRPGTLATHQIVGMGLAFEIAHAQQEKECARIYALQQKLWQGLNGTLADITLNGDAIQRVPHNLNVSFAGVDGESLLLSLQGLSVSSGSACNAATMEVSHVLTAIGVPRALADSSIRFSFGRTTTSEEIYKCTDMVVAAVQRLRAMSPL
jgi:cysteine desulfurase